MLNLIANINRTVLPVEQAPATPPVNVTIPVISYDNLYAGGELTTTDGTWSGSTPINFTYQWYRDAVEITGETDSTYIIVEADVDTDITVIVTATNSAGSDDAESDPVVPLFSQPCSYLLDGVNEYIGFGDILDSTLAGAATTWTASITFLRTSTPGADARILTKWTGQSNQRQIAISFTSSEKIRVETSADGTAAAGYTVITDNAFTSLIDWYTVDITFDGTLSGSTNVISIFVNGVEQTINSALNTSKVIFSSSAALRAGALFNSSGVAAQFFPGYINQINIWNNVLSGANILDKYNNGAPKNPADYAGLIGSWIGSGDTFSTNWTVVDRSAGGNNGTSVNMEEADHICS